MGAPEEVLAKARAEEAEDDFELWEENEDAFDLFVRLGTQWNVDSSAFVGLRYESVEALFRMLDVKNPAEMLDSIQVMERAAIPLLNERSK